ncbi:hypothetical protein [Dokdonella soli]|uniref:Uncharacterized protein n=1 Tax=Dokdonella soli TaxID=529810 RepID=A0ABP3U717_9GAMM
MRQFLRRLCWTSCLFVAVIAHAESPVPAALEPWRSWVMQGQEFRACPLIAGKPGNAVGDFLCAWPGMLALSADATGASFSQHWRVDADSWIALPGDAEHWPQQVSVDGQPAAVLDRGGPVLRLAAGSHEIRARIPWRDRPQSLRVPQAVGLVALSVDGKPVAPVQRDGDELSLGRASVGTPEADSLELRVYRRLGDGVPATLTTVVEMYASGQAREEIIGPALPEGFAPLALNGDWPARLDADGRLRVRVQPGNVTLTLEARATAPLMGITTHLPASPWPKQEIWSYAAAPRLRVTSATGAVQVDPRQAQVPSEWYDLPAFALADAAVLKIDERSRGLAADDRNRLTLDREMRLDFDGAGWFAHDRVRGAMLQGWRFDVSAPFALERADAIGRDGRRNNEALLVTRGAKPELSGVEWRTPAVDLDAGLRIASASARLPIAGWLDTFDRVTTTLHLPNGYKLLAAPGADRAVGSWISQWTLLDVFIAAMLVLLAWRWAGWLGAVIAAGYLVLGYQEGGAPLWSLLAAIALTLIARALPNGRLVLAAQWLQRAALLLLVLAALPFVADQLRYALHPQLEDQGGYVFEAAQENVGAARKAIRAPAAPAPEPVEVAPMSKPAPPPAPAREESNAPQVETRDRAETYPSSTGNQKLEVITVSGPNIRRSDVIGHYSESTVVQTGAGEPGWNLGRRYELSWSGPVLPAQDVRLLIAPPWLVRLLRIVLVALLAWLIVRLLQPSLTTRDRATPAAAAALGAAIGLAAIGVAAPAQAQTFPPDNLLNQLRTHLTAAPKCAPICGSIAKAEVDARAGEVRVALEAHSAERIALPLPFDEKNLALRSLTLDGVAQDGAARSDGKLWLALPRGVHRVELVFVVAADKVALAFPLKPMRAQFSGDGWEASGIGDDRLLTESLTLVRIRENGNASATTGAQQFAPFVSIGRRLSLGLDWTATTTATRLAPKEGGFAITVPVLAGEHVTSAGFKVEDARVTAAIADGEKEVRWDSTLAKGEALTLTAPPLTDRTEVWHVLVSPTWHVEFSGVPGVAIGSGEDTHDYRNFEFHPLPGESLTLKVTQPEPAKGATRAIDAARLTYAPGQRAADSTLLLTIRASQGGEQVVALPADAEVLGVGRNGEALNLRLQGGKLSLPIVPGTQTFELRFRNNVPQGLVALTPVIALGAPAANIDLGIELPQDRWLLATGGPAAGPAVLYWSELAVMLLIAFALARTRRTSLKTWQWMLLGLGFSTFSWLALLIVVAWLFAFDWRARATLQSARVFNLVQVGLATLTLVALLCLFASIQQGLLGSPDMHVTGNGSSALALRWFADRSADVLPVARAVSVPLWVYKIAMLVWALWLASALVGWLRGAFAAWTRGGYWRSAPRPVVDVPPPPPQAPAQS